MANTIVKEVSTLVRANTGLTKLVARLEAQLAKLQNRKGTTVAAKKAKTSKVAVTKPAVNKAGKKVATKVKVAKKAKTAKPVKAEAPAKKEVKSKAVKHTAKDDGFLI